ncbi:MAG: radical SAM protein [Calditrichaceae bacterium]
MTSQDIKNIVFGPVPSRRLGRSLGINNIPPKICSYGCIYCQVGKTNSMSIARQPYYSPQLIFDIVKERVSHCRGKNEPIDYLAFVPDGEPTLDLNLGETINLIKSLDIPIAVITNSSLINREEVQNELLQCDWISFKADSVDPGLWHLINRPHGKLMLNELLNNLIGFKGRFRGTLVTETMIVQGINDGISDNKNTADYLARLQPDTAYIALPIRPPAESSVRPASAQSITNIYQIFKKHLKQVELLTGYEGNKFSSLGNIHDDILSITAVHPMRMDALQRLLRKKHVDLKLVDEMLSNGEIVKSIYRGQTFVLKAFN